MARIGFGTHAREEGGDFAEVRRLARAIEELGFDSVWVYDHFYLEAFKPQFECWITMTTLAVETRLRVGSLVICNSYRWPPLLAKMAATLDAISNGRLEFGIGAGWAEKEYIQYGIPFPPHEVRLQQLDEAIAVIKDLWSNSPSNFTGRYYQTHNAYCSPKPIQKPHPPIWVGGKSKGLVEVAAKHADYYNAYGVTLDQFSRRMETLRDACRRLGRRTPKASVAASGLVRESQAELSRALAIYKPKNVSVEEYTSKGIVGTVDDCIRRIESYVDAGSEYFIIDFPDMADLTSAKIFMREVAPSFS